MVLRIIYIFLLSFVVVLSSCNNDDKASHDADLTINKTVTIAHGDQLELAIGNGNGGYKVVSSDTRIATAIVDSNKLTITAMKDGRAILTLVDKTDKELNIAVDVSSLERTDSSNELDDAAANDRHKENTKTKNS